jgi:hypothetical protein
MPKYSRADTERCTHESGNELVGAATRQDADGAGDLWADQRVVQPIVSTSARSQAEASQAPPSHESHGMKRLLVVIDKASGGEEQPIYDVPPGRVLRCGSHDAVSAVSRV